MKTRAAIAVVLAAMVMGSTTPFGADDPWLKMSAGLVSGPDWTVEDLDVQLERRQHGRYTAQLQAGQIKLPLPAGTFHELDLQCADVTLTSAAVGCLHGRLRARSPWLGDGSFDIAGTYGVDNGHLELAISDAPVAGSLLNLALNRAPDNAPWSATIDLPGAELATVLLAATGEDWQADGTLSLTADLHGDSAGSARGRVDLALHDGEFSRANGRHAGENLAARLSMALTAGDHGPGGEARLSLDQGQLYVEPVFLDAAADPLHARGHLRWRSETGVLALSGLQIEQRALGRVSGATHIPLSDPARSDLDLRWATDALGAFYTTWLQPFVFGTPLGNLEVEGGATGHARLRDGELTQATLGLAQAHAEDRDFLFAVYGMDADLQWQRERGPASRLSWEGAHVQGLRIGSAALAGIADARGAELLESAFVPVLDGGLAITDLRLDTTAQGPVLYLDAELLPVSLAPLTRAFGWPALGGTIAGRLPGLRYHDRQLEVGGTLEAELFDGTMQITGLRILRLLGPLPRLEADIEMRELDLELLTRTFDFGHISGRLNADVERLRLLEWSPVAFDARIYTPPGVHRGGRISQRAIDNLAGAGAGPGTGLQQGITQFFSEFAYARIGLGCSMRRQVCTMSGIEPAGPDSYVIVRGRMLPRIEVIGHHRSVSWPALLEQLEAATAAGPAEVR